MVLRFVIYLPDPWAPLVILNLEKGFYATRKKHVYFHGEQLGTVSDNKADFVGFLWAAAVLFTSPAETLPF